MPWSPTRCWRWRWRDERQGDVRRGAEAAAGAAGRGVARAAGPVEGADKGDQRDHPPAEGWAQDGARTGRVGRYADSDGLLAADGVEEVRQGCRGRAGWLLLRVSTGGRGRMTVHRLDTTLARDLKKFGAFDIDACFNCGNCTAVCQHSSDTARFPRRLIRYGQLGMVDKLAGAKEAWLCWNCRYCSGSCPREARPGEYVEAVRRYTIASMDSTGISRLMYTSSLFLV